MLTRTLLREPLVHFVLLGALLFAIDAWRGPARTAAGGAIVVSESRISTLVHNFARTWQRAPTRDELDGLIEAYIREEVMVREALALGLDRDDTIIRRRLQQKVEFVADQAAALSPPTDDQLNAYLQQHADAFRAEPRISFVQVYLDPRKRGATLQADAARLRNRLTDRSFDPEQAGDVLRMLEPRYEAMPRAEVERVFGTEFAAELVKQPVGAWAGPLRSGYGVHLVRVDALTAASAPSLEQVRPLVEREWLNARRQELAQAYYARLRAQYTIRVHLPGAPPP